MTDVSKPFSLYIHIPYCKKKCPYCDFNTYALQSIPEEQYVNALIREFRHRTAEPEWQDRSVQSIYFGGGTPSLFSPLSIGRITEAVWEFGMVSPNIEITLEANPGALSEEQLAGFLEEGINRLSMGVQSFSVETLQTLGRVHSPEQVFRSFESAREVGFLNINLDLMYGVPGQSLRDVSYDLEQLLSLEPEHVSAYGLTIEKGTPFYQRYHSGEFVLPEEDEVIAMMGEVSSQLRVAGYNQYEVSNYSRPGYAAFHNSSYWIGDDYLGLGAGAHSYVMNQTPFGNNRSSGRVYANRWANVALPYNYMARVTSHGEASAWSDTLKVSDAVFEFLFLGLRMTAGVSRREFEERFGAPLETYYPKKIGELVKRGLLLDEGERLRISEEGFWITDSVVAEFSEPLDAPEKILVERPVREKNSGVMTAPTHPMVINS